MNNTVEILKLAFFYLGFRYFLFYFSKIHVFKALDLINRIYFLKGPY